jgi:gliding motility-associated-like protein
MNKIVQYLILLVVLISLDSYYVSAQVPVSPNCPGAPIGTSNVQIFGPDTSGCGTPIGLTAASFGLVGSTDSYTVAQVPYSPYPFAGPVQITSISTVDDIWSDSIGIPFDFCFFGQTFSKFIASSNGTISFDLGLATGGSLWNTAAWGPMPVSSVASSNNFDYAIVSPHHDIDPGGPNAGPQTQVTYGVYGTAPCRAFVISWDSIPLFSCTSIFATHQIVLYETTNIIDIIIKEKTLCTGWNGGIAYQGIQDNGTKAFTVPGRNGTQWTDSLSQWRFTPAGIGGSVTYQWFNLSNGANIGSGPNVQVNPITTTSYAVLAFGCPNTLVGADTHTVWVVDPTVASFVPTVKLGCEDDTIYFDNTSQNANGYVWSFGDGQTTIVDEPIKHIYVNQNIYTVTLIANKGTICSDTIQQIFDLRHPINAAFVADTTLCLHPAIGENGTIAVGNFSNGGGIVTTFDFGDGTQIVHTNTSVVPLHNYTTPGTYTLTVSVVDTLGCVDTARATVYVEGIPYAYATATDSNICVGDLVSFNDSITDLANSWTWTFPGGFTLTDIHDPIYAFANSGNASVDLNVDFLYCPDLLVSIPMTVGSVPAVDLGPDTAYCDGYSSPILLPLPTSAGFASSTSAVNWSTGATTNVIAVSAPGTYWAQANTNEGCVGADTIIVRNDCYINIPNAFTPGPGDDLNQNFFPTGELMRGATNFEMSIYNRWGEQIFTTKSLTSRGWDGKFGGKPQSTGAYVYSIAVTFKNGKKQVFHGNVTLIR